MAEAHLILTYLLKGIAASLYFWVARMLWKRPVSATSKAAQNGFVYWWGGLGLLGIYGLIVNNDYGIKLGEQGLVVNLFVLYVVIIALYGMLGGLVYYLLFLYTGKPSMLKFIVAFYAFMTLFLIWILHFDGGGACLYEAGSTACVQPTGWVEANGAALSSVEPRSAAIGPIFGLLLVVPILAAAVMYFLLYFRVQDATSKYRVLLISGGLVLWMGFSTLNSLLGLGVGAAVPGSTRAIVTALISQVLGVVAAMLVVTAYNPPTWVQQKFGVRRLDA